MRLLAFLTLLMPSITLALPSSSGREDIQARELEVRQVSTGTGPGGCGRFGEPCNYKAGGGCGTGAPGATCNYGACCLVNPGDLALKRLVGGSFALNLHTD